MNGKYPDNILEYVGDISQIANIQESRLSGGRAEGVRSARIINGSGLDITVLPDRGMDIAAILYKGYPLHYQTGTGITSPSFFNDSGTEWLRSFYAGALTSCGLSYFGQPQTDRGKELGLHGRIANTPAEDVGVVQEWIGSKYHLRIQGRLLEVSAFGENLSLTRSIETKLGQKGFRIRDLIRNKGFSPQPLMMLYHFNFGFPFLKPGAAILGPILDTKAGNSISESMEEIENYSTFLEPVDNYPERLFFHTLGADKAGRTLIALVNRSFEDPSVNSSGPLGVIIRFDLDILPYLVEWKMIQKQFYVLGLEPCTCLPLGRELLRRQGNLPSILPQSEKEIIIDYEIIDSRVELKKIDEEIQSIIEYNKKNRRS